VKIQKQITPGQSTDHQISPGVLEMFRRWHGNRRCIYYQINTIQYDAGWISI